MRKSPNLLVNPYRILRAEVGAGGGIHEVFEIDNLMVISSDGFGWDHVRARAKDRCPTWEEMAHIKSLFWDDEELVVQFHPPKSAYVNADPYTLHLWRQQNGRIELPPKFVVMGFIGPDRLVEYENLMGQAVTGFPGNRDGD